MTSYLSENPTENLQNSDVHIAQIAYFGMEYLENHCTEVSDGSFFFCIFHAVLFELNFFLTGVSL